MPLALVIAGVALLAASLERLVANTVPPCAGTPYMYDRTVPILGTDAGVRVPLESL